MFDRTIGRVYLRQCTLKVETPNPVNPGSEIILQIPVQAKSSSARKPYLPDIGTLQVRIVWIKMLWQITSGVLISYQAHAEAKDLNRGYKLQVSTLSATKR